MTRGSIKAPLRAAVIGVGAMGQHHARVYTDLEAVELVAVADPDEQARAPLARRYGLRAYADYREMLDRERPDLVSVAVPTALHSAVAEEVIGRGISLLIEKPIAASVEEGRRIIDLARTAGVHLGIGHIERFNPAVIALKQHLDQGELGRIFQISVRRISPFPSRIMDVGVVIDLATHDLDILYYLTGSEVQRVSAEIGRQLHTRHEDLLCALLRFQNGVIGLLHINWLSPTKIRELVVNGEGGMFVVDYLIQELTLYKNRQGGQAWETLRLFTSVSEGDMIRYHIARQEPLRLELEAFVRSVLCDQPFPVSGEDGLRALALAQRILESSGQCTDQDKSRK